MEKQSHNSNGINKASSRDGISYKHFVCQNVDSNIQKYVVHHGKNMYNCIKIEETAAENDRISLSTETPLLEEFFELQHPVNCKKPEINSNDKSNIPLSSKSLRVSKGKCIAIIKNTENGKIVTSLKSVANLVQRSNRIDTNLNHNGLHNGKRKNFNSAQASYDKNNLLETKSDIVAKSLSKPEVKTQNVMTIIPNNKTLSFNQNAVLAQENNTPVASIKDRTDITDDDIVRYDTKCGDTQNKGSKAESRNYQLVVINGHTKRIPKPQRITDIDSAIQSNVQNKNMPEKYSSDRLHIIKKAMDSVKDNELRELALQALTDCGIGLERYVPIHPPEEHKTVHDTQVQTVVFGLLDPKSFILMNKDLEDIHRINQTVLHDMPGDENLLVDNPHSNNNFISRDLNVTEQESPFDLDSFIEQFWKENSDALKMKETLSMTKVRCNSLLEHLQKDFECVKRYDQNGMLNIHNAVISDNIFLVRRHVMILEYCKQSVDILTESGMTSLELAIKYHVCSEIVKLLLDAGAQSVIPKSIHESAVIIASKQSSPLLSMLVNRVSDSKLLDQIDSDGYAAIHYCTIHGNLQGVKVLISAGATIDLKDMKSGRTSLFHAIDNGHTSVMHILLKAGAVANIANYAGQTALSVITDPKSMAVKISLLKDTT